jgi:hypothetical protein
MFFALIRIPAKAYHASFIRGLLSFVAFETFFHLKLFVISRFKNVSSNFLF